MIEFAIMYAKLIEEGLEKINDAHLSKDQQQGKRELLRQVNEILKKYETT